MKKLLSISLLVATLAVLMSCGGGSSPKSVVEKSFKCIQKKDYEGYVKCLYIRVKEGEDMETQQKAIASMVGAKLDQTLAKKGGVKSYEVLSEEVTPGEEGKPATAAVNIKVEYGNGDVEEDKVKLKKDESGEWKIDAGK